jgi:hypothetical protein
MKRKVLIRVKGLLIVGLVALIMSGCDLLEEKPRAPLWVLATPQSTSSIKVTWEDVKNAESYEVYSETETSDMSKLGDVSEATYLHENLTSEAYTYFIRAKNSSGVSHFSLGSIPMKPWGTTAGSSPTSAIEITSAGVDGSISLLSSEQWYKFTKTGSGALSAKDKDNNLTYTADIVVDIYSAITPNMVFATINGQPASRLNLGGLVSVSQTWSGTYYVRVYPYSISTVGTFQLSFN